MRTSLVSQIERYSLLGVRMDGFTLDSLFEVISESIITNTTRVIGNHNLHSVYLYHHDRDMRTFCETVADYVFIDGMPLVFWGKLMGLPLTRHNRLTYADILHPLMALCAHQRWRVLFLGGKPDVADTGAQRLIAQYPALQIQVLHGYFDMTLRSTNQEIVEVINRWQPHILLVGMGMPRQERWILEQHHNLMVPCILTVGAALDYVAGAIPTPPRWMSRLGFEWLARLAAEPRRLGKRYLVEPWFLLPYVVADARDRVRRK